ncbi:unnamed protein product [Arabidopsis halleri]
MPHLSQVISCSVVGGSSSLSLARAASTSLFLLPSHRRCLSLLEDTTVVDRFSAS